MISDLLKWMMVAAALVLIIEIAAGRHKGVYNKGDFPLLLGSFFLGRWLMVPLSTGMKAWLFGMAFSQHQGALAGTPLWIAFPAVLLLSEFCFYWVHRWAHESASTRRPWLWKTHRTHHSGKHMNVSLIYRLNLSWFFIVPSGWITGLALYLGLGEAALATILTVQVWNLVTHSNFRWDDVVRRHKVFGPVFRAAEHVFVSPGIHHTHHGYGKDGKSFRNYCTVLSLYDWIFGTLHIPEGRPSRYGLPGKRAHWLEELFYPLVNFSEKKRTGLEIESVAAKASQHQ